MQIMHYLKTHGIAVFFILAMTTAALAAENPAVTESNTQNPDSSKSVELNRDYFKGYVIDAGKILTAPARWNSSDWLEASLITGVAVGLYTRDGKIQTRVEKTRILRPTTWQLM